MAKLKELGIPFTLYWTGVWACTGVGLYGVIEGLEIDLVNGVEGMLNEHWVKEEPWKLNVPPSAGNAAAAFAVLFLFSKSIPLFFFSKCLFLPNQS